MDKLDDFLIKSDYKIDSTANIEQKNVITKKHTTEIDDIFSNSNVPLQAPIDISS